MPFCKGGDKLTRKGYRYNKSGVKQIYNCNLCNRRFTPNDGFWKMKNTPETITEALDLYKRGFSLKSAVEHLWKYANVKICAKTVRDWVLKYGKLLGRFSAKQQIRISKRIHEDEVVININGAHTYFWHAKTSKERYKFTGPLSNREYKNCLLLNRLIKKQSYQSMLDNRGKIKFVTDKLGHYMKAFNKLFRNVCQISHGIPIKCQKKGLKYNNNTIECEHPAIKTRIRQMKGTSDKNFVSALLCLMDTIDNFTRNINGKTPAQRAGLKYELGINTLLSLIRLF